MLVIAHFSSDMTAIFSLVLVDITESSTEVFPDFSISYTRFRRLYRLITGHICLFNFFKSSVISSVFKVENHGPHVL